MLMTSLMEKKKQVLVAQLNELASKSNEETLEYELSLFFQSLKEQVLHELSEYWPNDEAVLLQGQLDLILAPIFESQQQYYNILRKYNIKEYKLGAKQGRRLVKLANKPLSSFKSESTTLKVNKLANLNVDKDELFGTNDWTQQRLLNQSFTASENTMNRVDQDINKIISDGYKSGEGVNKVAANIENRFNQLKTWESKRIARTEMHNAHQMGIMNSYYDLGVEYVQWSSAHDKRVRFSHRGNTGKHKGVDGEIIPLGALFSNGLRYPGDTQGPIEEWINCRCGLIPFIIPEGYMAPSFSPFRERDLIPTLDYWNQEELLINSSRTVIGEYFEKLSPVRPIKTINSRKIYPIEVNLRHIPNKKIIQKKSFKKYFGLIEEHNKNTLHEPIEYLTLISKEGNVLVKYKKGIVGKVSIPKIYLETLFHMTIHNHEFGQIMPSYKDMLRNVTHKVTYGVITSENIIGVIKFGSSMTGERKTLFINEYNSFILKMELDFQRKYGDNLLRLPNSDYNEKFRKYVAKNTDKYVNEFNLRLKEYNVEMTYITISDKYE